jgi:hypothetical protein
MTSRSFTIIACGTLGVVLACSAMGRAQSGASAKVHKDTLHVNLLENTRDRRIVFDKDKMTLELGVQEMIVGRVKLEVVKPAFGDLEIELLSRNSIELTKPDGSTDSDGELICPFEIVSSQDVAARVRSNISNLLADGIERGLKEARIKPKQAVKDYLAARVETLPTGGDDELFRDFALQWAMENAPQPVLDQMRPAIDKHSKWFSRDERDFLLAARGRDACNLYCELCADELYDEQLHRCGLALQTEGANARQRLAPRFNAVFFAMGGKAQNHRGGKVAAEALSPADRKKLRQAMTADLKCRFTFTADPADANSLWCNAQRVASPGAASSVTIEGQLAPDKDDHQDWWQIAPWKREQTTLDLPPLDAAQWEQYPIEGGLLLRVVAIGQQPVTYRCDMRPVGKAAVKSTIVLHETPTARVAKFPY